MRYTIYLLFLGLLFTGCLQHPSIKLKSISYGKYTKVPFESIPSWQEEDFIKAFEVFVKTCQQIASKDLFTTSCSEANSLLVYNAAETQHFFEKNFTPFLSLSRTSLATGYYEPLLEGSLVQSLVFSYPVYATPIDMLKIELSSAYQGQLQVPLRGHIINDVVKPYFTREEINSNALSLQVPICYVKDKIDLFFLHVQGSGCVQLEDDTIIYVGYADQNGHPYVSIGEVMIQRGLIKEADISLESIRSYLQRHPSETDAILNLNPSYVFFEKRLEAATGSLGVVLEKERSIAVDRKNIPLGMPVFISTQDPLNADKYEKIVFAHDTGGAIKGESRIDIFFGSGKEAGSRAGKMKEKVRIWMLVPNDYLSKQEVK